MEVTHEGAITYTEGWTDDEPAFYLRRMEVSFLPMTPGRSYSLRHGTDTTRTRIVDKAVKLTAQHLDPADTLVNHPHPEDRARSVWALLEHQIANQILNILKENRPHA